MKQLLAPPVATSGLVASEVRSDHGWYRDSAGFCTSTNYDLTDAVELTFGL